MSERVILKKGDNLVIATHNQGKLSEFQAEFSKLGLITRPLSDFTDQSPEETATDFEGNAKIKALAAAKISNLPALADDSGFCIEALDGRPGLFSARFIKECGGLDKAFATLHQELEQISPSTPKKAYFIAALCLAFPDGRTKTIIGKCNGVFTYPPKGDQGHGYDPVFIPEGHSKTFAQMSEAEKNQHSHRGKALEKFIQECVEN